MAREFLLQLRNELHFYAGKSQDNLGRAEQLRMAELRGYKGSETLLPVEQLMREYIERTSDVRYIVAHFVASAKRRHQLVGMIDPNLRTPS